MSRRALPEGARRGWCPGLGRPMPTGDGLLARIHPPLGVLSLAQARAVSEGARRHGNGHLDLTARGNLQIRGVSEATREALAAGLDAAGLGDVRTDGGPQRLTLTGPLAGLDPAEVIDVSALARAIEAAGRGIPGLPAKTLVAVDMPLAEADLSIAALDAGTVAISLAGGDRAGFPCPLGEAVFRVAGLLGGFARSGKRRIRDLTADERGAILRRAGLPDHPSPTPAAQDNLAHGVWGEGGSLAPGPSVHSGLTVLALDAPFGRCTVDAWDHLIRVAQEFGARDIRLSPTRGIVLVPTRPDGVAAHLPALAADFITTADDPRRAVAACTGAPACASGTTPTLRDASRLAEAFRPFAARGLVAHVSGCAKGCARPGPADLTLVGRDGTYDIVVAGSPGDPPLLNIPIDVTLEQLGRAATVGLAAAFARAAIDGGKNRRPA